DLHVEQGARRAPERHGRDQAGDLVAGKEGAFHRRLAGHPGVLGVTLDATDDRLRDAAGAQDRSPVLWGVFERRVDLPVEVVEQTGQAPRFRVLAEGGEDPEPW